MDEQHEHDNQADGFKTPHEYLAEDEDPLQQILARAARIRMEAEGAGIVEGLSNDICC